MADEQAAPAVGPVEPEMRIAEGADRDFVHHIIHLLHAAMSPLREEMMRQGASPNSDTMIATAVATYCGTIFGELVGMGVIPEATLPKCLESMKRNMESGAKAGITKVARVAEEVIAEEKAATGQGEKLS